MPEPGEDKIILELSLTEVGLVRGAVRMARQHCLGYRADLIQRELYALVTSIDEQVAEQLDDERLRS